VSDYEWGDVPYHYGTWFDDPRFGWVWVPGYTWAPAWVVFRTGPDYIGWAPVSPRFYVGGSWSYGAPASPFVFVPTRHFCEARVGRYVVPERQVRSIYGETRVANTLVVENNVVVNRGPDPRVIERASGRRLIQVPIESVPRAAPGGGVTRSAIAVNPRQNRSLRAAEPVPTEQSLPDKHQQEGGPHGTPPRVESVPRAAPRANTPPPASSVRPSHEAHPHDQHPPDTPHTPSAGAKPKPKPAPKAHGKPPAQDKPHGLELATPGPRR
jgi:hypothetical protein